MGDQTNKLAELSTKVKSFQGGFKNYQETPKWKWPSEALAIVNSIAALKHDYADCFAKLNKLFQWPDGATDPKLFYGGKKGFETFDRGEDWFEQMGFVEHELQYTFTNTWDKVKVMATWLVPSNLEPGDTVSFVWFAHGGGLVSDRWRQACFS
jgi:hypothetical protein